MKRFLLIGCLLLAGMVKGQNPQWKNYTTSNTTPMDDGISFVAMDTLNEEMLFGTTDCRLNTFDGSNWSLQSLGNPNHNVSGIVIDGQGNKWIGTTGSGVFKLSGTNVVAYHAMNSGLKSNNIISVAKDTLGNMWFGTNGGGVSMYDGINWTTFNTQNSGLGSDYVKSIIIDSQGAKWFNTGQNITKFDGVHWTTYIPDSVIFTNDVFRCMALDAQNNIWIGTHDNGVLKFDGTIWQKYNSSNSGLINNTVNSIAIDTLGVVWFGTSSYVSKFDGVNWTKYNIDLVDSYVYHILIDANNNKWFGTLNGISKFDDINWTNYSRRFTGLAGDCVNAMAIDAQGNKWFGTNHGVSKFDGILWEKYTTSYSGLVSDMIYSIYIDTQGNKWFGTDKGVLKYDGINWTTYNSSNSGIASDYIRSMIQDAQGNIWFGTANGVSKFNGTVWQTYNMSNSGLTNNDVVSIAIDSINNKWFGTYGGGVCKFDGVSWVAYNTTNSGLSNNTVRAVEIDANNNKWFGTYGGGVSMFSDSNWLTYTSLNSELTSDWIADIASDKLGNMWFTTSEGICFFNGIDWQTYDISNPGTGYNSVNCISFDSYGNKWFGTMAMGVFLLKDPYPFIPEKSSLIKGKIFLDSNNNLQKDSAEFYLSNQKVKLMPDSLYAYTNSNGEYILVADTGKTYTLSYEAQNFWSATTPNPAPFVLHDSDVVLQDIGINAPDTTVFNRNIATLTNRCNMEVPLWYTYTNAGTVSDSGNFVISIDTSIMVIGSYPAYDSVSTANKVYFHFNTITPGASRQVKLNLLMPGFQHMGDTLLYISTLSTSSNKQFTDTLEKVFTCGYDPNIKEVNPAGYLSNHYTLKSEDLDYTIHFQNTGNDTAFNIRIIDTLSSYLDWNSFKVTGSSHVVNTTLNTSGKLNFTFYDILLPDSNHSEPNSHGFVSYKIKCKPNIPEYSVVKNTGYIYFDFNPAVVTNTSINTMVSGIPKITNLAVSICAGDSAFLQGTFQTQTGVYYDTLSSHIGFDSIIVTNLQVNNPAITFHLSGSDTLCIYHTPVNIALATPTGGQYSGTGVNGTSFSPQIAGTGWHVITYTYTDSYGCSNAAMDSVYVSSCTGIKEKITTGSIRLYPNPTNNVLNIQLPVENTTGYIRVYNVMGQQLCAQSIGSTLQQVNMSTFSRGLYLIEVQTEKGRNLFKVVKE